MAWRLFAHALVLTALFGAPLYAASPKPSATPSAAPRPAPSLTPPAICSLLKPDVCRKVKEDRDIVAHARLEDRKKQDPHYSFYTVMLTRASLAQTRRALTDYRLYAKMISYVERSDFDEKSKILTLEGGIWKFRMKSLVRFDDRGDRWVHFRIVAGHFRGLEGDFYFESLGEKGTLVYLKGEQNGTQWPPRLIVERGAEIVFSYTAKRMRSYIESLKDVPVGIKEEGDPHEQLVPQPRRHL